MNSQPPSPPPADSPDPTLWDPARVAAKILDGAGEGIVAYDREFRYRVWNQFVAERTGTPAAAVLGRVAFDCFPVMREQGVKTLLERALAGEVVHAPEPRRWQSPDGHSAWLRERYEPFRDDTGAVIGVLEYLHDITTRKHAEDELRQSAALYRTIIESAYELVLILERDGRVRYASPSLVTLVGLQPTDVLGRNPIARIHPDDQESVREAFRQVVREPWAMQRMQYRSRHADGSWRVLTTSARNLLDDPSVRGVVATSRDVTALEELQAHLHQSQRIEAVGRLAGGVAHDFNNLLTVIRGNAQLMYASGGLSNDQQEELEEISQAAERASSLTRQLLAFSQQQVLQPRTLDLNEVVRSVHKLLDRLVGDAVTLELREGEALGAVTADPAQVEQVLLNLVVNARDAMPSGGHLVIETANLLADEAFARAHPPMPTGDYVQLTVKDTGIGMDALTQSRAFEPFFTTKAMGQGRGMGLSTVYGVVKQSGGFIWVDSAPGAGATFSIYLPRTAMAGRAVTTRAAAKEARHGSETILVAEDEHLVRTMTRRTLERAGYSVYEAANGAEALTIARELGERLDLVITDIVMPVMGGRELAAALAQERPSLTILFMSGYTHERDAHLSAGGGISHFLHKPFTLEELRGRVRLLLDQTPHAA
ncbi:MAG: PAS domain S-box protein [Gemmatimonadaceae bacterium]|nr:PAS domain S-box protein [Gemmatimonadaceae bacterium]